MIFYYSVSHIPIRFLRNAIISLRLVAEKNFCSKHTLNYSRTCGGVPGPQTSVWLGVVSHHYSYRAPASKGPHGWSKAEIKLADKQQKLEQKMTELQDIKDKVNFYDVAYFRFDVPEIKVRPPKITERPPRFGNIDDWTKAQNANIREQFHNALTSFGKTVMDAAKNSIIGERKFRLMNQRDMEKLNEDYHTEKNLRHQQIHETLDLLALFEKPDTAKLVREVAVALMGGRYVNIPCAGGGSVSSETG